MVIGKYNFFWLHLKKDCESVAGCYSSCYLAIIVKHLNTIKMKYTNIRIYWAESDGEDLSSTDATASTVAELKDIGDELNQPFRHKGGELVAELPDGDTVSYHVSKNGNVGRKL